MKEFGEKTNRADVHKTSMARMKRNDETVQEYVLVMHGIVSRAHFPPEVVIQYIIDGISDDPGNKIILYGAKSYEEFKEYAKLYNVISNKISNEAEKKKKKHQPIRGKLKSSRQSFKVKKKQTQIRCFRCGPKDQLSKNCPPKEKGTKCFSRNELGHRSTDFPSRSRENNSRRTILVEQHENQAVKNIIVQGETIQALIDTESNVNLIRNDDFLKFEKVSLQPDTITFTGIGGNKIIK